MSFSFDDACAFACTLPDVEMQSFYGTPVPKLNGKAMLSRSHEEGCYALYRGSNDAAELLIDVDPATFWQTPHYQGTCWTLVREEAADPDMLKGLIEGIWSLRASKKQRIAHPHLGA